MIVQERFPRYRIVLTTGAAPDVAAAAAQQCARGVQVQVAESVAGTNVHVCAGTRALPLILLAIVAGGAIVSWQWRELLYAPLLALAVLVPLQWHARRRAWTAARALGDALGNGEGFVA